MTVPLIIGGVYLALIAVLYWQYRDRYIEFTGTLRTHLINFALIAVVTVLVVAITWDVFVTIVAHASARRVSRVFALYLMVPIGVFITRYCTVDLGGFERVRWPAVITGWTFTTLAAGLLLLANASL